jgi:alpha-tubulin suppressor-like RCC1 family protein
MACFAAFKRLLSFVLACVDRFNVRILTQFSRVLQLTLGGVVRRLQNVGLWCRNLKTPMQEPTLGPDIGLPVQQASAGGEHCLAVTKCGRLFTWGSNFYGQTGFPASPKDARIPEPREVLLEGR